MKGKVILLQEAVLFITLDYVQQSMVVREEFREMALLFTIQNRQELRQMTNMMIVEN